MLKRSVVKRVQEAVVKASLRKRGLSPSRRVTAERVRTRRKYFGEGKRGIDSLSL